MPRSGTRNLSRSRFLESFLFGPWNFWGRRIKCWKNTRISICSRHLKNSDYVYSSGETHHKADVWYRKEPQLSENWEEIDFVLMPESISFKSYRSYFRQNRRNLFAFWQIELEEKFATCLKKDNLTIGLQEAEKLRAIKEIRVPKSPREVTAF